MDSKYIILYREDGYQLVATKKELIQILEEASEQIVDVFELGRSINFKITVVLDPEPVKKELKTTINERVREDVKRTTIGAYGAATEK